MAEYLISGVWFSSTPRKHVSHVMLHSSVEGSIHYGQKVPKQHISKLLKSDNVIRTAVWDVENSLWKIRANVEVETVKNEEYLRAVNGNQDTLMSLMRMHIFPIDG